MKSYSLVGCIDGDGTVRCTTCCIVRGHFREDCEELHTAIFGETETQCSEAVCEDCHASLGNRVVHDGGNTPCGYCGETPC